MKLKHKSLKIEEEFADLDPEVKIQVGEIMNGKVVGRDISHVWCDRDTNDKTVYCED